MEGSRLVAHWCFTTIYWPATKDAIQSSQKTATCYHIDSAPLEVSEADLNYSKKWNKNVRVFLHFTKKSVIGPSQLTCSDLFNSKIIRLFFVYAFLFPVLTHNIGVGGSTRANNTDIDVWVPFSCLVEQNWNKIKQYSLWYLWFSHSDKC